MITPEEQYTAAGLPEPSGDERGALARRLTRTMPRGVRKHGYQGAIVIMTMEAMEAAGYHRGPRIPDATQAARIERLESALHSAEGWIVDGGYLDDRDPNTAESASYIVAEIRAALSAQEPGNGR